ncbi:unnamed protein product [Paramecium pentaurelia]|uniref:Protein kinase domain-containing protein n=1 Tax=Paramecium pentaurelia TaxID=43138 RepID=A0A8S1SF06_9CILI|nr:unnamed protein product [Paramecium pentaurelia]
MSYPLHLSINSKEYIIKNCLGQGSFGKVYQAEILCSKKIVAIKVQNKISESEKKLIQVFKGKNFKNLVNIYDYQEQNNLIYIVMEYCSHSLYDQIQKKTINPKDIRYVLKQIMNGLSELHNEGLAHRDLKPENILICHLEDRGMMQEVYKLCDFGTSKQSDRLATECVGTPYYLAPEQILKQTYDKSVDIWALGAVMYELFTNVPLFSGQTIEQIYSQILNLDINKKIDSLQALEIKYKNLLKHMLIRNPQERINLQQIKKIIEERISQSVEKKPQVNLNNLQIKESTQLNLKQPNQIPSNFNQNQKPPLHLNLPPKQQSQIQQFNINNQLQKQFPNQNQIKPLQNFNQISQIQNSQQIQDYSQIKFNFQGQQRNSAPDLVSNIQKTQ